MPKMIEISAAEYERLQDCIREDGFNSGWDEAMKAIKELSEKKEEAK